MYGNLTSVLAGNGKTTPPTTFKLLQNYPNPFNPSTTLNYELPSSGYVSLVVYDLLGRQVVELEKGYRQAGYYSTRWDASFLASGVYYARFTVTDELGQVKYSKVTKLLMTK
jgi:hypothetical protein